MEGPRGRQALNVSIVFTSFSTFIVACRFYTRLYLVKQTGADDWLILVSLIFSLTFLGLFAGETFHGMGIHLKDIPPNILRKQLIFFWATVPIYQTSLITAKASILFQYRRVFPTKRMRMACNAMIGVLALYGTWTILSAWLNCIPVSKFWDDSVPGNCLSKEGLWFSNSAMHILTDVIILILPMPVLKSLQLPKKQKIALMGVFALGGFVCITSILRLKSLYVISKSTDPTWDNPGAATWSAVECNVAIICASLPSLRPLLSRLFPRIFSHLSSNQKSKYGRSRSRITGFSNINASVTAGDQEYGMYDMKGRRTDEHDVFKSMSGIKVTTEFSQESAPKGDETSSERKLVLNAL